MTVRLSKRQKIKILHSKDLFPIMQKILLRENKISRSKEHFWVVGLNTQNTILFIELVALGSIDAAIVKPAEIFRMAIYKLATQIIIVHNHPSGELKPSQADRTLTENLLQAAEIVKIEVSDHLIISEKNYFSFKDKKIVF